MNSQYEYFKGFINQKLKEYDYYYCYTNYDRTEYRYTFEEIYCYFTNNDIVVMGDSMFSTIWQSAYKLNLDYSTFATRINSQSVSTTSSTYSLTGTALNYSNIKKLRAVDVTNCSVDLKDTNSLLTIGCVGIFLVFFIIVLFKLIRNRYGGIKYGKI